MYESCYERFLIKKMNIYREVARKKGLYNIYYNINTKIIYYKLYTII